jgi:hypothetical protein
MPGLGCDVVWQIAESECFRLHFQVDLRVNVRGVQGDVPEPRSDGIDVYPGAKQMDGARMAKTVRANALCRDRRQRPTGLVGGAANKAINAEARQWLIAAVEKDEPLGDASSDKGFEHIGGALPNWAGASLIAFANQTHRWRAAPGLQVMASIVRCAASSTRAPVL